MKHFVENLQACVEDSEQSLYKVDFTACSHILLLWSFLPSLLPPHTFSAVLFFLLSLLLCLTLFPHFHLRCQLLPPLIHHSSFPSSSSYTLSSSFSWYLSSTSSSSSPSLPPFSLSLWNHSHGLKNICPPETPPLAKNSRWEPHGWECKTNKVVRISQMCGGTAPFALCANPRHGHVVLFLTEADNSYGHRWRWTPSAPESTIVTSP